MGQAIEHKTRVMIAVAMAFFAYGMSATILGTVVPAMGKTPAENGVVAFAQGAGLVVASLLAGAFLSRLGNKAVLIVALAVLGTSLALLPSAAHAVITMAACFSLQGLGSGLLSTAANFTASEIDPDRRTQTLNFLNVFFGLGGFAAPLLAAKAFRGRPELSCYALALLLAAVTLLHAATPLPKARSNSGGGREELKRLLREPVLWLLAAVGFLYVACETGMWNWLPIYLERSRQMSRSDALSTLSWGFAAGLLLGRLAMARLPRRVPPFRVLFVSAIVITALLFLLLGGGGAGPFGLRILVFLIGLAMSPMYPTTLSVVADVFRVGTAMAMGIVITAGWVGISVSSGLIGMIAGGDDSRIPAALYVLAWFAAAATIATFILARKVKQEKPENAHARSSE